MTILWYIVSEMSSATDRNFFVILGHFSLFYPPNCLKMKISTKLKKCLEISFYTSLLKIMIICYTVLEIWHVTHVIVIFHFELHFSLYLQKNPWRYHHFTQVYGSWDKVCDGRTDGKIWHIEVGAPPKNK